MFYYVEYHVTGRKAVYSHPLILQMTKVSPEIRQLAGTELRNEILTLPGGLPTLNTAKILTKDL